MLLRGLAISALVLLANGARADDVYVSLSNGTVGRIAADGTQSTFASGFQRPRGIAFDATGDLFVADSLAGTVSKVTPAGAVSAFASGFQQPEGLAFDTAGNLYVADQLAHAIRRIAPDGTVSTFASGLPAVDAIAIDSAGNVFASSLESIQKITPAGVISEFLAQRGFGLTFDAGGNLFVGEDGAVIEVTPGGQVSTFVTLIISPNLQTIEGLAFDSAGNLYAANDFRGGISKVSPSGVASDFYDGYIPYFLAVRVPEPTCVGLLLLALIPRRRRLV